MGFLALEFGNKKELEMLANEEKGDISIQVNVVVGERTFFTLKKKDRQDLKEGELVIVKSRKGELEYEFIAKIGEWGKINIPLEIVRKLVLKNKENVGIIIVKNKPFSERNGKNEVDLLRISKDGLQVMNRGRDYVTIYKKECIPVTLPRFVKVTPDLIEAIYLVHGDGHYKSSKLFFSNVNYQLHKFVMDVFEDSLGISREHWRYRINHSDRSLVEKSKKFWIENLNLKQERFYETKKLSKFNTKEYGDLRIILENTVVTKIFQFLLKEIKIKTKRENLIALNGILAAEGSAQIGKKGLHKVTISFSQKERPMFKKLLENAGINFFKVEQDSRFCIRKWEEQYALIKGFLNKGLMPFNLHIERKYNIIHGFLDYRYTKTLAKYLAVIRSEQKDYNQIAEILQHRKDSVLDTLSKKRYKEFIVNRKKIAINKKGHEFLEIIEKLQFQLENAKKAKNEYTKIINNFNQEANMGQLPFESQERKILVKRESVTNSEYGKKPEERTVKELLQNGVICLNKPQGPSSHQVADYVKRILKVERVGHGGTLE